MSYGNFKGFDPSTFSVVAISYVHTKGCPRNLGSSYSSPFTKSENVENCGGNALYWMCSMAMQKEPIYSRYLPYICLNFREYPNKNMARNMVLTYLHFRILLKLLLIFSRACLKLWYRLTHRLAISMIRNTDYSSSSRPIAIFSDKPV